MTHVYELDGRYMQELKQAHIYLKEMLNLPEYYGMNADSLFDCLTEQKRETLIFLYDSDQVHQKILRVFAHASAENPFLTVIETEK